MQNGLRTSTAVAAITCTAIALATAAPESAASTSRTAGPSITYTARVFMRGMRVTAPVGWTVHEDHPGEFNLASPPGPLSGTNIQFWLDPVPSALHGVALPAVGRTPSALIGWLRHNRFFLSSRPVRRRVAGTLETTSIDLDVKATAPREDPGCPNACITYFVFHGPGYSFPFGTGHGELTRLYFATLGTRASPHTFTIAVETPSPKAFKAITPTATRILASLRLPSTMSPG